MLAADCSTTASVQVEGGSWRTLQGVSGRRKKTTRRWPYLIELTITPTDLTNQSFWFQLFYAAHY